VPVYSIGNVARGELIVRGAISGAFGHFPANNDGLWRREEDKRQGPSDGGGCGVLLWPRFHPEMDEGGGGSLGSLNQCGERKEREWGPDSVQPSGGKKGGRCCVRLSEGRGQAPVAAGLGGGGWR
jgi:hypothetical protein